jgi:hemoglobin/transferrin/lactoferrin receptor protein
MLAALLALLSVAGVITDPSGAPVPGARVQILTPQQAVVRSASSDNAGRFDLRDVPPGSYVVVVTAPGFSEHRVAIDLRDSATVPITLQVAPVHEDVTVSALPGLAEEAGHSAQIVSVITADEITRRVHSVVAEAVAEEPGVNLQRTSPTMAGIFVRGLTGNKVNVFFDGVRYSNGAQRGGVNTFLDLIDPAFVDRIEVVHGPSSAEYGSDALGGTVQFQSPLPSLTSADRAYGFQFGAGGQTAHQGGDGTALFSFAARKFGLLASVGTRKAGEIRTGDGIDSHAAVTRFLGLRSDALMPQRLPDTGFHQYAAIVKANWTPNARTQLVTAYAGTRQDEGKRYDQLLGGDGNLIADLDDLTLDLFYARVERHEVGWFDHASATYSLNSQREERINQGGNGNPRATIGHEPERTTVHGVKASAQRALSARQSLDIGGDIYFEKLTSEAFNVNPVNGAVSPRRPRVPSGATFRQGGVFAQTAFDAVADRLRLIGAVRVGGAAYAAHASDSPLIGGAPLWPDDQLTTGAFTFRASAVATPTDQWTFSASFSRGFRAPHMTDLGTLGLTGSGFEVAAPDVANRGAEVGNSAAATAVSTGRPVEQLRPESNINADGSVRFRNRYARVEFAVFVNTVHDNIQKQALIVPPGAVGTTLGTEVITAQNANGVVFVAASPSPVLVRTNFDKARIVGVEHAGQFNLTRSFTLQTVFTYLRARDLDTDLPPNIEGGTPAPDGYLLLQYAHPNGRWWVQPYLHAAAKQTHLSSLDLEDRRTGAGRSRTSIRDFFLNGATARGWVGAGPDGVFGSADDVLLATGETVTQVQDRVLGVGVNSSSLFRELPGYAVFGVRAGIRFGAHELIVDAENLGDKNFRGISWGMDAPGRGIAARFIARF